MYLFYGDQYLVIKVQNLVIFIFSSQSQYSVQVMFFSVTAVHSALEIIQYSCFTTTHGDEALHGWFIFNLHTKSRLYLHNKQSIITRTPCEKKLRSPTYWEGQCLGHGGESPSTLVPCLVATASPFDSYPLRLFPTTSARLTLYYNDDIINLGLLHSGQ